MNWKGLITDLMGFGGLALISTGCWMIHRPSALIVTGVLLLIMAFIASQRTGEAQEAPGGDG